MYKVQKKRRDKKKKRTNSKQSTSDLAVKEVSSDTQTQTDQQTETLPALTVKSNTQTPVLATAQNFTTNLSSHDEPVDEDLDIDRLIGSLELQNDDTEPDPPVDSTRWHAAPFESSRVQQINRGPLWAPLTPRGGHGYWHATADAQVVAPKNVNVPFI